MSYALPCIWYRHIEKLTPFSSSLHCVWSHHLRYVFLFTSPCIFQYQKINMRSKSNTILLIYNKSFQYFNCYITSFFFVSKIQPSYGEKIYSSCYILTDVRRRRFVGLKREELWILIKDYLAKNLPSNYVSLGSTSTISSQKKINPESGIAFLLPSPCVWKWNLIKSYPICTIIAV